MDDKGYFKNEFAVMRIHNRPAFDSVNKIDVIDVAPNQIISIATSLIPFLEHLTLE